MSCMASALVREGWEAGGRVAALGSCTEHLIDPRLCATTWVGGEGPAVWLEGGVGPGGVLWSWAGESERMVLLFVVPSMGGSEPDFENRGSWCLAKTHVGFKSHHLGWPGKSLCCPHSCVEQLMVPKGSGLSPQVESPSAERRLLVVSS